MGSLYDADILLWSEQQAELLSRLARGERVNHALDFANLIEEVESVGRSELHVVESLLELALTHLLAAHGARRAEPVLHWLGEADTALGDAARRYAPSMNQRIDLPALWARARRQALRKLATDGGPVCDLPETCPFPLADLVGDAEPEALLRRLAAPEG
jgi:Domain of unknown function DUF29